MNKNMCTVNTGQHKLSNTMVTIFATHLLQALSLRASYIYEYTSYIKGRFQLCDMSQKSVVFYPKLFVIVLQGFICNTHFAVYGSAPLGSAQLRLRL